MRVGLWLGAAALGLRSVCERRAFGRRLVRGSEEDVDAGAALHVPLCASQGRRPAQPPQRRRALGVDVGRRAGQEKRGYTYYTKVAIHNCVPYGSNEYGADAYLLLFRNITAANYPKLDDCQRSEYKRLQDLDAREKAGWLEQPAPGQALRRPQRVLRRALAAHERSVREPVLDRRDHVPEHGGVREGGRRVPGAAEPACWATRSRTARRISLDEAADIFRARLAAPDAGPQA